LKNLSNRKNIIGIAGYRSNLAINFIKLYKSTCVFKLYKKDINNHNEFRKWIQKNKNLNYFINFAAITSVKYCKENKKKALLTNYNSVVKITKIIKNIKMNNFLYFLCLSSSHVFKKTKLYLKEDSVKKPDNYYGYTKLMMENYIQKYTNNFYYKIGIARVFNYYDKKNKKSFFIKDIKIKLQNNKKKLKFTSINTKRDFIHSDDVSKALKHMLTNKLNGSYNVCSGIGINLKKIILYLNKKYKNKKIIFDTKKNYDLIGNNNKLLKTGWKVTKKIGLNYFA